MNLAAMAPNRSIRDAENMRRKLDENLAASRDQSPEAFAERRRRVLEQNAALGFGTKRFDFGGSAGVREVPLAPLSYWAIRRWSRAAEALPDWKPVSPQGIKQIGDRQDDLMEQVQQEYLGLKASVLVAGRRTARGKVVFPSADDACEPDEIAVIPHAGPEYYRAASTAAAVIAMRGGAMSHLAQVGLEEGFLIVRVKDAASLYPSGAVVEIDAERGEVSVVSFSDDERPADGMKP